MAQYSRRGGKLRAWERSYCFHTRIWVGLQVARGRIHIKLIYKTKVRTAGNTGSMAANSEDGDIASFTDPQVWVWSSTLSTDAWVSGIPDNTYDWVCRLVTATMKGSSALGHPSAPNSARRSHHQRSGQNQNMSPSWHGICLALCWANSGPIVLPLFMFQIEILVSQRRTITHDRGVK